MCRTNEVDYNFIKHLTLFSSWDSMLKNLNVVHDEAFEVHYEIYSDSNLSILLYLLATSF